MNLIKTVTLASLVLFAGAVSASQAPRVAATGTLDCQTQFDNCISEGLPTYKCMSLYNLCMGMNSVTTGSVPGALDRTRKPAL